MPDGKVECFEASTVTENVISLGKIDLKQDAGLRSRAFCFGQRCLRRYGQTGKRSNGRRNHHRTRQGRAVAGFYLPVLQLAFGGRKVTVDKAQSLTLQPGSYGPLKTGARRR